LVLDELMTQKNANQLLNPLNSAQGNFEDGDNTGGPQLRSAAIANPIGITKTDAIETSKSFVCFEFRFILIKK